MPAMLMTCQSEPTVVEREKETLLWRGPRWVRSVGGGRVRLGREAREDWESPGKRLFYEQVCDLPLEVFEGVEVLFYLIRDANAKAAMQMMPPRTAPLTVR